VFQNKFLHQAVKGSNQIYDESLDSGFKLFEEELDSPLKVKSKQMKLVRKYDLLNNSKPLNIEVAPADYELDEQSEDFQNQEFLNHQDFFSTESMGGDHY
jgi:hypothetical protein